MKCSETINASLGGGSSNQESPVRRFPRVGSQFQTRISKATGMTIRPAPDKMSVMFPFLSEKEVEQQRDLQSNEAPSTLDQPSKLKDENSLRVELQRSYRGGSFVCGPSKDDDRFWHFMEPFVTSTSNDSSSQITNEEWVQHMIHLHSTESGGKRSRASRGGTKRKRSETEELIWSFEKVLDRLKKRRAGSDGSCMFGEEQALVLQKFRQIYDGKVDAAEFDTIVNLSGGQALKMRKSDEKERIKRKSKTPSQQTSESWRDLYESSTLPYVRTVMGQVQDDALSLYAVEKETSPTRGHPSHVNIVLEPEDSKGAWRSILACGKSIERQLNCEFDEDRKPMLFTLLEFIRRAYALPTPESCFGTHHVIVEEVSNTIISILNHVKNAQNVHAKIRDKVFNESTEGIDSEDLAKFLDTEYSPLPIRLVEADNLVKFRKTVVDWETRLASILETNENELEDGCIPDGLRIAENLRAEAKSHGYKSRALVQLDNRLLKAYDLRNKILKWKHDASQGKLTSVKTLSTFVKEGKRIKLFSTEVKEIIKLHRIAEEWIDRANVVIRSKMSLSEIKRLIERGEEFTLDLSEHTDKLRTRVRIAEEWLNALNDILALKSDGYDGLTVWKRIQASLGDANQSRIHELSSEGNRIPVDIPAVKFLHLALDAKNWTTKAKKWLPSSPESKKGKLSDLREHIDKVSILRSKLPLPCDVKMDWKPVGENELSSLISSADNWLEKYACFVSGDNRRNDTRRSCLSMIQLKKIVDEGNALHVNMGNPISKIMRVRVQAESWYESNLPLLARCGIVASEGVAQALERPFVGIQEMSSAVDSARMDIPVDLDEAVQLQRLLERCNTWKEKVKLLAPKRNKRHNKGGRPKFTLSDLIDLIEESTLLPIDTEDNVQRLQIQLNTVEIWRAKASVQLQNVAVGFENLKSFIDDVYGKAHEYSIDRFSSYSDSEDSDSSVDTKNVASANSVIEMANRRRGIDLGCLPDSEEETPLASRGSNPVLSIVRLLKQFDEEMNDVNVSTSEGDLVCLLYSVSKWCMKSFKYLNSPREVFDKRYFGAFDRFIVEGEEFCKSRSHSGQMLTKAKSISIDDRVTEAWKTIVTGQLVRLMILKSEREKFQDWCKCATRLLGEKRGISAEKLMDLAKSSRHFPANRDLVSKVRGLSTKLSKWLKTTRLILESKEKIGLQDAKNLIEQGEKLGVRTDEIHELRIQIQAARNWGSRAKEYNLDQGAIDVNSINQLIDEHDGLLIEMPDELEGLRQASVGYCICRRPYEGFMIGCDHCEEWYHGPCIGFSESKADRLEKFLCIRCATKKNFYTSSTCAVSIIRKWTCRKELKKARQVEAQKLQRKERKEKKDIEKLTDRAQQLEETLTNVIRDSSSFGQSGLITKENGDSAPGPLCESRVDPSRTASEDSYLVAECANSEAEEKNNHQVLKQDKDAVAVDHSFQYLDEGKKILKDVGDITSHATCSAQEESLNETNRNLSNQELDDCRAALQQCKLRLEKVTIQSKERYRVEAEEDDRIKDLRHWCIRVRSNVLLPSTTAESERTRPPVSGVMPPIMDGVIEEANNAGISDLPDVKKMIDCFKTMCWSVSALHVLRQKPSLSQLQGLIMAASTFQLADEKALRTMKFMANKASQLQSKIRRALAPKAGEKKPFNLSLLKALQATVFGSPLFIPEEEMLRKAIEDDGRRCCTCGGPRYGNMLSCDACGSAFHLGCIRLMTRGAEIDPQRLCPSCGVRLVSDAGNKNDTDAANVTKKSTQSDISAHAPTANELWPPFGLADSKAASDAFGSDCLAIPNEAKRNANDHTVCREPLSVASSHFALQVSKRTESAGVPKTSNMISGEESKNCSLNATSTNKTDKSSNPVAVANSVFTSVPEGFPTNDNTKIPSPESKMDTGSSETSSLVRASNLLAN